LVTFIHAADLHLDSPLRGLPDYEGAPLERVRSASRRAFSALVDVAIERQVDFVVLAGDVWDGAWQDVGTGLFFVQEVGRLTARGVPVFMIRGNHDAESRITQAITFPDGVKVFSSKEPESVELPELSVVLHGQSFPRPDVTENIALAYPAARADRINIGLLHTALEGYASHATYAPCTLAELQAKGYDYWALGHVHEHQVLADDPASEGGTIAFPGVLQGRHARETGPKGALFVELGHDTPRLERMIVDVVRWKALEVDVTGAEHFDDVARRMGKTLREAVTETQLAAPNGLLAVRLTLTGGTPLHGRLQLEHERMRNEALAQALSIDAEGLYIEKVQLATAPAGDPSQRREQHDAIADIQAYMADAPHDPALVPELRDGLRDLLAHLPPDVARELRELRPETIAAIEAGTVEDLIDEASISLVEYLARE
jgi:exonuclease SbcD